MNPTFQMLNILRAADAVIVADAEAFGSPDDFSRFIDVVTAAVVWPKGYQRYIVATLNWASDKQIEKWAAAGWHIIEAHPRPRSLLNLCSIRRLFNSGPVVIFPCDRRST